MAKILMEDINTDVFPVMSTSALSYCEDDAIVWWRIDLSDYSPESIGAEEYQELTELVEEHYEGSKEVAKAIESEAQSRLQDAFNEYELPITVLPGCEWHSGNSYNIGWIDFDAEVDAAWVDDTLETLSTDQNFIKFLKDKFSHRSGFISRMPNSVDGLYDIAIPLDYDYWKVVSAIVQYIVSLDKDISDYAGESFAEDLSSNCAYVGYSMLNM